MQFVTNGPDVPERLLQAHEDRQVVFFCGAGISVPAGLPKFDGLVAQLYARIGIEPNRVQARAIKAGQFDTAVGLLEAEAAGGRQRVRQVLANVLEPNLAAPDALATHRALLALSRTRDNQTRLITTNFDRLFEEAIGSAKVERFFAPLLPVPKSRWNGLVYLHGRLPDGHCPADLEKLVVSSGDFGLAYLTERWAARFVGELFRNFTVCFVGYSLSDPVLRYMTDALAADRVLGESLPEVFAFDSYSKGGETDSAEEWEAKNVTPILYKMHWRHAYLHRTLRAWSKTYRDGAAGKEQIVVECALARPLGSTEEDDFVGRLLWALSDASGIPAKRFADFDPVPGLDWLGPFSEVRFGHDDLVRFDVPPKAAVDESLQFALTRRPAPYDLASWMALARSRQQRTGWDTVMWHIARWLMRHLDNPDLLLWLVGQGDVLHQALVDLARARLRELNQLLENNDTHALQRIRDNAPDAIPRPEMQKLWDLLLAGRVRTPAEDLDLYAWCERFKRYGFTGTLRLELRDALTPHISLRKPFPPLFDEADEEETDDEAWKMSSLVQAELVLPTRHVRESLREAMSDQRWGQALPSLLSDFTGLLRDALDLLRELGLADDQSDRSYVDQPSIGEHPQNTEVYEWTFLIELTRDAWVRAADQTPDIARTVVEVWCKTRYPMFRRLSFFAAGHHDIVAPGEAVEWLLADDGWWLWSIETMRETCRLIVALAPHLEGSQWTTLERAILAGPPRAMYRPDIEPEAWERIQESEIWLRLAKAKAAGATLGAVGEIRWEAISGRHPKWQLADDERDEFPVWTGKGNDWREFIKTPRPQRDLCEWLKANGEIDSWQEDDWAERCRAEFDTTTSALIELTQEDIWPIDPWRQALQVWAQEELVVQSWNVMAAVLMAASKSVLHDLSHAASWWLGAVSKSAVDADEKFYSLCDDLLALDYEEDGEVHNPVDRAINHPVGLVTEALLDSWYQDPLRDGQGLTEALQATLSKICDLRQGTLRHGRVVLAGNVIALFRVDIEWTTRHLLPLFDWRQSPAEARFAWEGFLASPRLYRPLIEALRQAFLDTARHYSEIGRHDRQYSSLLTFAALDPDGVFKPAELRAATASLPQHGLENCAETLVRALRGSGHQAPEYWRNRVFPYLTTIWPQGNDVASRAIAESLARVCIEAQQAFPKALNQVRIWLRALPFPARSLNRFGELKIYEHFPVESIEFLDLLIGDNAPGPPRELRDWLVAMRTAEPDLAEDHRFRRLAEYLQMHGHPL